LTTSCVPRPGWPCRCSGTKKQTWKNWWLGFSAKPYSHGGEFRPSVGVKTHLSFYLKSWVFDPLWGFFSYLWKNAQVNHHFLGQNSPNLATLPLTPVAGSLHT
jgi:hypothetical protein